MDDSKLKLINTFSSSDRLDRTDQRLHAHEEQKEKAKPRYADNFFRVVACVKAIVCGKAFSGGGEADSCHTRLAASHARSARSKAVKYRKGIYA